MRRVTIPILIGEAVMADNSLNCNYKSELILPQEAAERSWLFSVYDKSNKKIKRTRIKIDDNVYIASIPPEKVMEIIDNNKKQVGFICRKK